MSQRLAVFFNALVEGVIPETLRRDADVYRQARRVAAFAIALLLWTSLFSAVYVALGSLRCGLITLWAAFLILGSLVALERGRSPALCGNLMCAGGYISLTALALVNGGWQAPPVLWYSVLPVVSVLTSGVVWGLAWTLIPLASIAAFAALELTGYVVPIALSATSHLVFWFAALGGLIACQYVLACIRGAIEHRALAALHDAERRLAETRACLESLQAGFGFSPEEWGRLQREKLALEYMIKLGVGDLRVADDDLDSEFDALDEEIDLDSSDPELRAFDAKRR